LREKKLRIAHDTVQQPGQGESDSQGVLRDERGRPIFRCPLFYIIFKAGISVLNGL